MVNNKEGDVSMEVWTCEEVVIVIDKKVHDFNTLI